jgi:hypothetical protein
MVSRRSVSGLGRRRNLWLSRRVIGTMQTLTVRKQYAAPAGRPQPLAFVGKTLWAGCWETDALYAIDPDGWKVTGQVSAPGKPYGLACIGNELRVVVSIGADDDRYLFRFVPGTGFDEDSKTACPDLSGSHLTAIGDQLYLAQLGQRRILALGDGAAVLRTIDVGQRFCGIGVGTGGFHIIAADDEFDHLQFATFDINASVPQVAPVADIDAEARALAFDGANWWTSYREKSEIVTFSP